MGYDKEMPSSMISLSDNEPDMDELNRLYALLSTDPSQALAGFRALSERGSIMSMVYLGNAYSSGTGTEIDLAQAEEWYQRAADAGSVHASYELGKILLFDRTEYGKAREAFLISASRDFGPSMNMLAMMFLKGQGVPVDATKARDLLERGVAQGHIFSKRNLGILLMRGRFGARQCVRGLGLFLSALGDAVTVPFSDRYSDRLR